MEDISLEKNENNSENEHSHDKISQGLLKRLQVKRRSYSTSSHSSFLSRSSSDETRKT